MAECIELQPHDPSWTVYFKKEESLLRRLLGNSVDCVNHVGSTAIPTIRAKPVIDIAVEAKPYPPDNSIIQTLQSLGYKLHGESGVTGRIWFTKGIPRKFNLHWCPINGNVAQAQIQFRDALIANPKLANEYETLKLQNADRRHIDSTEYADLKTEFILKVLSE